MLPRILTSVVALLSPSRLSSPHAWCHMSSHALDKRLVEWYSSMSPSSFHVIILVTKVLSMSSRCLTFLNPNLAKTLYLTHFGVFMHQLSKSNLHKICVNITNYKNKTNKNKQAWKWPLGQGTLLGIKFGMIMANNAMVS